jgi:DNA-binding NtrC family response regulator
MRILIALGDWKVRWELKKALRNEHAVKDCGKVHTTMQAVRAERYDFVVASETYQDGTVADLWREIRRGWQSNLPVLLWTGDEGSLRKHGLHTDTNVSRVHDIDAVKAALNRLIAA